ncbi:MAG: hypothetical protein D6820_18080 [Lentisphaerae bacterium]|nr:MAG: hypothetical protein D6820_18080 [Lentisphaerota bacterium]
MTRKRNVILILTDQQHYRSLGINGCPEAQTPNLDALGAHGVNFRNYFVTNPVCSPSRGSLFTGRHITEHGLWANGCALPQHVPTIPQVLRQNGYQTALFGKLHLVPIVSRTEPHPAYGFEICEVAEGDQQLLDDAYFRWLKKEHTEVYLNYVNEMYTKGHTDGYTSAIPEECHLNTWITERGLDFLKNRRDEDKPFFLNLSYFDPHHAFNPCEPYASRFRDCEVSAPRQNPAGFDLRPTHMQGKIRADRAITTNSERMTGIIRAYHAMVAHIDHCVGRVLAALRELGLDEDTVVIFTSDHGELLGNHEMLWKGPIMLDDLLRVPFIIDLPGGEKRGLQVDHLASGIDLFPTILEVAGLPSEELYRGDGRCMVDDNLVPPPSPNHEFILAEWEDDRAAGATRSIRCLRTAEAKLVYYPTAPEESELYVYHEDPDEFFNRYRSADHRHHRDELFARLCRHYLAYRPAVPRSPCW